MKRRALDLADRAIIRATRWAANAHGNAGSRLFIRCHLDGHQYTPMTQPGFDGWLECDRCDTMTSARTSGKTRPLPWADLPHPDHLTSWE